MRNKIKEKENPIQFLILNSTKENFALFDKVHFILLIKNQ